MKRIASKIGIIDDIAYQTNLLALNTAIETTQEIGDLASSSVTQAERAGALLTEMVTTIQTLRDLIQEIASASEELATTAKELGSQANSCSRPSFSSKYYDIPNQQQDN